MKPVRKARINVYDGLEVAAQILGMEIENDEDYEKVELELFNKFSVFPDEFTDIISRLIPLIMVGNGLLTGTPYRGFGDGNGCYIVKEEIK